MNVFGSETGVTASDICQKALFAAGVTGTGQAPSSEEIDQAWDTLNGMLAQWQEQRALVYHLVDASFVGTSAVNYQIGPSGSTNLKRADTGATMTFVNRPEKFEDGCFVRQLNPATPQPVDWPIKLLASYEDYNQIRLKQLSTFSWAVFYDPGYPNGLVYPWPLPTNSYEIHLLIKEQLQTFPTLTTAFAMPGVYYEAIWTNLATRMNAIYPDNTMSQRVEIMARDSLATISAGVTKPKTAKLPPVLRPSGRFNIFSGSND